MEKKLPKCPKCGHKFPIWNKDFKWWTCTNMICLHQWSVIEDE